MLWKKLLAAEGGTSGSRVRVAYALPLTARTMRRKHDYGKRRQAVLGCIRDYRPRPLGCRLGVTEPARFHGGQGRHNG